MKTTINKDFFKKWKNKKVVMCCKTKEEAVEFCKIMHENGLKWCGGDSYLDVTNWRCWGDEDTCYEFNGGTWNFIEYFKNNGFTILEFSDYIVEKKMKTTINKDFFKKWKDKAVVMHCKTKEEANEFCKLMHDNGLRWRDGASYLEINRWRMYKENTCFSFNEGVYDKESRYSGYIILEFSDYVVEEKRVRTLIDKDFFDKYRGEKVVMHCTTKDEAKEFCRLMHENEFLLQDGSEYYAEISWMIGNERMLCFNFVDGQYGYLPNFLNKGFRLLRFRDYVIKENNDEEENAQTARKVMKQLEESFKNGDSVDLMINGEKRFSEKQIKEFYKYVTENKVLIGVEQEF